MTGTKNLLQVASGGNGTVSLKKGEIYKFTIFSDNIILFADYDCWFDMYLTTDTPPPAPPSVSISSTEVVQESPSGTGAVSVTAKYNRLVTFKPTIDSKTKKVVKVKKIFKKITE